MPPLLLSAAACRHDAYERSIAHLSRKLGVTWERIGEAYGMDAEEAEAEFGEPGDR